MSIEHDHLTQPLENLIGEYNTVNELLTFPRGEEALERLKTRLARTSFELLSRVRAKEIKLVADEEGTLWAETVIDVNDLEPEDFE